MCVGSRYSAHHQQENIYPHIWPNEEHMVEIDGTFFQRFTVRFSYREKPLQFNYLPNT